MNNKYKHLLLKYVNSQDHFEKRGYFGNIDGAPKCGCVEDMPMMTGNADCTEAKKPPAKSEQFSKDEVQACQGPPQNDLAGQIKRFNEQQDIFKFSLLEKCPRTDEDISKMLPNLNVAQRKDLASRRFPKELVVPELKLDQCTRRAAICCFTKRNDLNGEGEYKQVSRNADVCFRENINYHCTGFAWSKDASDPNAVYKQQLLQYITKNAHDKGLFGNIYGAAQCGCAGESFPTITDASCVQHDGTKIDACKDGNGKDMTLRARILASKEDDQKELVDMSLVNVCPMDKNFKSPAVASTASHTSSVGRPEPTSTSTRPVQVPNTPTPDVQGGQGGNMAPQTSARPASYAPTSAPISPAPISAGPTAYQQKKAVSNPDDVEAVPQQPVSVDDDSATREVNDVSALVPPPSSIVSCRRRMY